jgi:hypothetical protein
MEKSSQIAWKLVPVIQFFPLKVVPLIEVLLYIYDEPCWKPVTACYQGGIDSTYNYVVVVAVGLDNLFGQCTSPVSP